MIRYAVRRLLLAVPTLFAMLTVVFILVRLVPGDAAVAMLGDRASAATLAALRAELGLDQPVSAQYLSFMSDALRGDFGRSLSSGRTVVQEVAEVLPYTLELTLASVVVGVALGLPLGTFAALRRNRWPDYASRLLSLLGLSFPSFVSAILMLLAFAVWLQWLPVMSRASSDPLTHLRNLILPALNLGLIMTAYITRVTRSSMLEVLGEDYIRTARAKGVRPMALILRHGLRNALIPIVTVVGVMTGVLLGGAVVIESVFSLPGVGRLIIGAIQRRDYPIIQGGLLITAATFVFVNILVDLAYGWLDPRVRNDG